MFQDNRVLVNKLSYRLHDIHRGDVVVFRDPDSWLPRADTSTGSAIKTKFRDGLVLVGVLPNPAKQYLVKRVIGVAGDHIVCCTDKKLTINGTAVDEPYIFKGNDPSDITFDITVDPGKIWVMGDHRGASADSRYHQDDINKGQVPLSRVTGRVFGVLWPLKSAKFVHSIDVLK